MLWDKGIFMEMEWGNGLAELGAVWKKLSEGGGEVYVEPMLVTTNFGRKINLLVGALRYIRQ